MKDLAKERPAKALLEKAAARGGVEGLLNRKNERVKAEGWLETPPSLARFFKVLEEEPNVLRRPLLIQEDGIFAAGYDEAAFDALLPRKRGR